MNNNQKILQQNQALDEIENDLNNLRTKYTQQNNNPTKTDKKIIQQLYNTQLKLITKREQINTEE